MSLYQTELRKPVHTIFCLDYSGSMYGSGNQQLVDAMEYILNESTAKQNLLQFTEKDKITVIPFSTYVLDTWSTTEGLSINDLREHIKELAPLGSTNIYEATSTALEILENEEFEKYNTSIVLMTDGKSNMGRFSNLKDNYTGEKTKIPVYSILFGDAEENELQEIADLTNGKIFDGRTDLLKAFKEVRGYN